LRQPARRAIRVAAVPEVLLVSKPVAPPWNDSGKNLVRDLARHLSRWRAATLARPGDPPVADGVRVEAVYGRAARGKVASPRHGFSPTLRDNARVAARLLIGRRVDLWHFVFAPNVRSSRIADVLRVLRRTPTVHTVASAPRAGARLSDLLFADVSVVLSRHTEDRFLADGVPPARLRRIPPCVPPLVPVGEAARRDLRAQLRWPQTAPMLLYPGDLEFGSGAQRSVDALRVLAGSPGGGSDARLVLACRAKTPAAREAESSLRARVRRLGLDERVIWLGDTPIILDVLAAADVVLLPSTDFFAKMDLPLVLLEAMALERAVLVVEGTPAAELAEGGAALVTPARPDAIATAVRALLDDTAARRQLGARARGAALDRYAPATMAAAYEALYDEVVGR
jgi:phosphatidylinositol alpha-1,6-mannosyltransferase